jgi:tetratricopeptide (TPR) repeat protein
MKKKTIVVTYLLPILIATLAYTVSAKDEEDVQKEIIEHLEKGNEYAEQGEYDKAMTEYKDVLRLDENNALAHNNLGVIYKRKGLYISAVEEFQAALETIPNYYKAYNNLANVYFEREYYDEAAKYYEKCLKVNPGFAEAHWNLALCYEAEGEIGRAIKHYNEFKELSNDAGYITLAEERIYALTLKEGNE